MDVSFCQGELKHLRPGARVGVIVFHGSFCPITTAHVLALTEARALLCGLQMQCAFALSPDRACPAAAVDACVALVILEDQRHVGQRLLLRSEDADGALPLETRRHLAQLALRPLAGWAVVLPLEKDVFDAIDALRGRYPSLEFVRYEVVGADEVAHAPHCLENAGSGGAVDGARLVVLPRSPDPAHPDSRALLAALGGDVGRWPYVTVGPALPDVSAAQARAALRARNVAVLSRVCPPEVAAWLLTNAAATDPLAHPAAAAGGGSSAAKSAAGEHYSDL